MTTAGNSFENDGLPLSFQHRRVRERELWLAMQEAHKRWTHATEVLNSLTFSVAGEEVSPDESVRIAKAAEEQRLGFEEYIEARLEFSEFLLAREPEAGTGPEPGEESRRRPLAFAQNWWSSASTWKRGLVALAIALLCPAVFGLTFMHERKHVLVFDGEVPWADDGRCAARRPAEAGRPPARTTGGEAVSAAGSGAGPAPVRYRTIEFKLASSPAIRRWDWFWCPSQCGLQARLPHISVKMGDFRRTGKREALRAGVDQPRR
jgi:hypothetical protein